MGDWGWDVMTRRLRNLSACGCDELVSVLYRLDMFSCNRSRRGGPDSSSTVLDNDDDGGEKEEEGFSFVLSVEDDNDAR